MTVHTIDLRFVREAGWCSWLIDRGTGGFFGGRGPRWSHVGIVSRGGELRRLGFYDLEPDDEYEFGARSGVDHSVTERPGAQFRPSDYARFVAEDTVSIQVTQAEWLLFWRLALRVWGAPYSSRTIEGFLTGENIPEDPRTIRFDCSTLVAWLLLHASQHIIPPEYRAELRQISPNGLYYIARDARFYRRCLVTAFA